MNRFKDEYFDEIEISDRLDMVIGDSLTKVKVEKRKKTNRKIAISFCAFALVVGSGFGFCCSHTAYASKLPLIGKIFEQMDNKTEYKGDFKNDSVALVEGEDAEKLENGVETDNEFIVSDNGITVSITEVTYDKYGIYLGMSIQNENGFPKGISGKENVEGYILDYDMIGLLGDIFIKDESGKWLVTVPCDSIEGDFKDANTFIGITQIDLSQLAYYPSPEEIAEAGIDIDQYSLSNGGIDDAKYFEDLKEIFPNVGKKIVLPNNFVCDLELRELYAFDYQNTKEVTDVLPDGTELVRNDSEIVRYDGTWNYEIPVSVDETSICTKTVNELDEDGYGIVSVNKSKYVITVDTKLPSAGVDYFVVVCDANGDLLDNQGSMAETYSIDRKDISKTYVFVCDYDEYMNELKGYYWNDDYETKKTTKNFAQYLSEHAKYQVEVDFE